MQNNLIAKFNMALLQVVWILWVVSHGDYSRAAFLPSIALAR